MKKFWIKVIPWQKELITAALESGADAVWIEKGFNEQEKHLGKIANITADETEI